MEGFDQLSDPELDRLLQGQAPEGRPHLRPVADLVADLRTSASTEPAPVMAYELRRAIADRAAPSAPDRRWRRWLDAVAAGAAVLAFGAVGAAGALPAPLQNALADASGVVGVELPRADGSAEDAPGVRVGVALGEDEDEDEGTEPKAEAPPDVTPGGASPAAPATGDQGPATPAVAPGGTRGDGGLEPGTDPEDQDAGTGSAADEADVPDAAGEAPEPPQEPVDPEGEEPTEAREPDDSAARPLQPPHR